MPQETIQVAFNWYLAPPASNLENHQQVCPTRDVFQARLDKLYRESTVPSLLSPEDASLLVAVVGEIGNNCFDHNLGQWKDAMGCWFSWSMDGKEEKILVVVADRGQGVFNSLKMVKPDLKSEEEALKIAFEKRISGRSPEQRGNGLKFVRTIVNGPMDRGLIFCSGARFVRWGGYPDFAQTVAIDKINGKQGTGTLAFLLWGKQ